MAGGVNPFWIAGGGGLQVNTSRGFHLVSAAVVMTPAPQSERRFHPFQWGPVGQDPAGDPLPADGDPAGASAGWRVPLGPALWLQVVTEQGEQGWVANDTGRVGYAD